MSVNILLKDLGIYDLSSEEEVKNILPKINIGEETTVNLDLTGCLPDYPATSIIIDEIIRQIKNKEGEKYLTIKHEYKFPDETIINWLFLGSREMEIEDKKELSLDLIRQIIIDFKSHCNINLRIETINRSTKEIVHAIVF